MLAQDVFDRRQSLDRVKTLKTYHCKIFNVVSNNNIHQSQWRPLPVRNHWRRVVRTSQYHCKIFNVVDLCSGVGIVWSTTNRIWVNDATAVTFSIKCFNPLKLYPLSGNIFRKWFAKYFSFIHEHLKNIDLQW